MVAGVLAGCALILFLADRPTLTVGGAASRPRLPGPGGAPAVHDVIDSLFARYRIDRGSIKTWRVQTPDRKFARVEQRVPVPPDFISVKFNHDLNQRLAEHGARVIATERTKENLVTMHILQDNVIVRSISFVVTPSPL